VLFSDTNPPLADPRLEALRRLAVLCWHDGPAVPSHEVLALLDAGFTSEQHVAIKEHIHSLSERDRGTVALL
jgi:alkylhydroperoxidase family enzyme